MDILFLSVSTGGGHIKAAEALKGHAKNRWPHSRCLIVDTLRYISPFLDKCIVGGYIKIISNMPFLYGGLYTLSENNKKIVSMTYAACRMLSYNLIPLIKGFNPAIIVCTHTFPLQMVCHLKREKIISAPLAAVVTDFANHPFWKLEGIDALIVPHDDIKHEMSLAGIPRDIIYPYGIPVSAAFLVKHNRKKILDLLGLEDRPTGLVMGGSLGLGSIFNCFEMLGKSRKDIQIIVVAGKNARLKNRIERCTRENGICQKNIRVLGYTDMIPYLMDVSDFIITKPGGMTISEALVKELPMFLTSPIPGQEERNHRFLLRSGAAVEINPAGDICRVLTNVLEDTLMLKSMKEAAKRLARPYSCRDTVSLLEKLVLAGRKL
ncbi:MAG: UDP-N-acetylglucosamine--LPS N-acetylglucosamine transferase [Clostridiaceae bacterium]|nr:UDP-N-acetylglucosamine--LPS N-acetylglucosamine transferase [Clostridiaceae bacterium]